MALDLSFETQLNGQGALKFGDHSFQVSQRMILLGKNQSPLQKAGLIEKQIAGFPPILISGANRINSILNTKAADLSIEAARSINAFWFDSDGPKPDFIFLRIPLNTGQTVSSTLVMLYAEKGSGQRFMEALQDSSLDQNQLQVLLSKILQINSAQQIDPSQIITENLVIFPQSSLMLGNELTRQGANAGNLYQQHQKNIIVRTIPTKQALNEDEVDLSKFVKQSVFFRKDPEENPKTAPIGKKSEQTIPALTATKTEKTKEFNPHPRTVEINGRKITLQGLGMHVKGMTANKAAMLGIVEPGIETDYDSHNVFNLENSRKLTEMLNVFDQGINVVKGLNPFSTDLEKKILLVKFSDQGKPILRIRVPDRGSRNMYGEDLDWRPFRMFELYINADESELDYIAKSILDAASGDDVKTILDNIVHADINKAFGIPYNLDDRQAVLTQTEEVLTLGRKKSGNYYRTSYYSDEKNIRRILSETLVEAPPKVAN